MMGMPFIAKERKKTAPINPMMGYTTSTMTEKPNRLNPYGAANMIRLYSHLGPLLKYDDIGYAEEIKVVKIPNNSTILNTN